MARKRWPTFGYDSARVNAHIGRATGKWGRLKEPDEIWDYMEQYMPDGQANILNPPTPDATRKHQKAPAPICTLSSGRVVIIANGTAKLYEADQYGKPVRVLQEKPAPGNGRAYKCAFCDQGFQEWARFVQHCLDQAQKATML